MAKLDEYMKDPDSLQMDEAMAESLIAAMVDEPAEDAETQEVTPDEKPDQKPEADKAEPETAKDEPKDEPQQVIKTRDGKHEIPYSVLETERQRTRELQRQLDEARARQTQFEQQQSQEPQEPGPSAEKDDFNLEAYRDEFGDEAAQAEQSRRQQLQQLRESQQRLEKELADNKVWRAKQEQSERQREQQAQDVLTNEINEAIDSIPELSTWRNDEDPMWDAAVALDNRLMNDPAFKDVSIRERFETVVQRLTGKPSDKQSPSLEEDVEQKLAEKEKAARSAPNSLSDLPGGVSPDRSENDAVDRMSPMEIEAKLSRMTPDEQEAFLARL